MWRRNSVCPSPREKASEFRESLSRTRIKSLPFRTLLFSCQQVCSHRSVRVKCCDKSGEMTFSVLVSTAWHAKVRASMVRWTKALHCFSARNYRKRGSASYIVRGVRSVRERERERKRDRRKWRHHCRPKIGDEFTLSLAKKSHFSFLPSHFLSHHCGAEIHTFRCQNIRPLGSDSLLNGASRATSDRKPKTNDQILPSPIVLPIEKMNQINTKNYWK